MTEELFADTIKEAVLALREKVKLEEEKKRDEQGKAIEKLKHLFQKAVKECISEGIEEIARSEFQSLSLEESKILEKIQDSDLMGAKALWHLAGILDVTYNYFPKEICNYLNSQGFSAVFRSEDEEDEDGHYGPHFKFKISVNFK